jgi:hypothetical protein
MVAGFCQSARRFSPMIRRIVTIASVAAVLSGMVAVAIVQFTPGGGAQPPVVTGNMNLLTIGKSLLSQ